MRKPSRESLLIKYSQKPVRRFLQIDAWIEEGPTGDDILVPDQDGHVVVRGETYELMESSFPVRILIHEDSKAEDVLALLAKVYSTTASDPSVASLKLWDDISS